MTVEPGKGGQELITETLDKIQELKAFCNENNFEIDIEADGGINDKNSKDVINSGANILVSGNYIIKSDNYSDAIQKLKEEF